MVREQLRTLLYCNIMLTLENVTATITRTYICTYIGSTFMVSIFWRVFLLQYIYEWPISVNIVKQG